MTHNATAKAVIYVRQSVAREESISLESQEYICREYAAAHAYEVVGVETDPGISGRTWQRRGIQAAMTRLEERQADVLILWKWSRLSRNRRDWAVAADRADVAGARIESATEPIDTNSAAGRFQRGVMVEMAAFESDRIGETWKETHDLRIRRGLPATGGDRFGYQREGDTYIPDPVTGQTLADMYGRYLAGWTARAIAAELGGDWSYQRVRQTLDSGFGAGLLGRTVRKGNRRGTPPPWVRVYDQGAHDPVIDEDTWAAYKTARRDRFGKPHRVPRDYLFTGLVRCGDCGGPMSGRTVEDKAQYICSRSQQAGTRRVTVLDAKIREVVFTWGYELVRGETVPEVRTVDKRTQLLKRAARVEQRLTNLTLRLTDGTVSEDAYRLAATALEQERAALQTELDTAPNPAAQPASLAPEIGAMWPRMTDERRARVLRPLIGVIVVHPGRGRGPRRIDVIPAWEK